VLSPGELPPLDAEEAARTAQLAARIRERARERGGWLPFSEFMRAALYEPDLGYYMTDRAIFGSVGDFVTAPEMSPLFARCLAVGIAELLTKAGGGDVVEYGAGSGAMAGELLAALSRLGVLPQRYRIVEPSPALGNRQRHWLEHAPGVALLLDRIEWLESPPCGEWQGVAVANEVVDALPVDRFRIADRGCAAIGVVPDGGGFAWRVGPADPPLATAVESLQQRLSVPMAAGYVSEWCPGLRNWVASAAGKLTRGAVLLVDYGLPRAHYYHPSRDGGTLCGFRRHLQIEDVLSTPGAQDLTAWVDFSAAADAARDVGLRVAGFATQAHYLLSTGIERELALLLEEAGERDGALLRQGAATLLLPGEMGERFKILALLRDIVGLPAGFGFRDLSTSL